MITTQCIFPKVLTTFLDTRFVVGEQSLILESCSLRNIKEYNKNYKRFVSDVVPLKSLPSLFIQKS